MFRGLYTAANGMQTKQKRIETIANNLANTDTTSYKKDNHIIEAFSEKLLYKRNNSEGHMRATTNVVSVKKNMLSDGTYQTEINLSRGYLTFQDVNGKGYYKSGKIVRDEEGFLRTVYRDYNSEKITKFGSYLLDENGNKVKADQGELSVDQSGNLSSGGTVVAKIVIPEARGSIGTINGGALTDRVMTNYTQGSQESTGNDFHISLEGDGFFKVQVKDTSKVKYTRSGSFTMDRDGALMDHLGNKFVGLSGVPIYIPEDTIKLEISRDGSIYAINSENDKNFIDTLDIVDIENKEDMRKYGLSFFENMPNTQLIEKNFEGRVLQGYLERSNVNPIDEMVDMIDMQRGFEADQKVIQTYDQIMSKAANDIGKIQ